MKGRTRAWATTVLLAGAIAVGAEQQAPATTPTSGAAAKAKPTMDAVAAAVRERLQVTFHNVLPEFIGPGPIDGLYEMVVNNRLIYYVPEKDWLLFGEFFNSDGISETQRRLSTLRAKAIEQLPLQQAIKIGNGPNTVIEFSDPDCPFCKRWEQYASARASEMTRYVFLVPLDALHPTARQKAVDILCAPSPGQRLEAYLKGVKGTATLTTCREGKARLAVHERAARTLGVTGTPTLVVNGTLVTGFNPARITNLLDQKE